MQRRELATNLWIAPRDGCDDRNLRAVGVCGFRAVTDGFGLDPRKHVALVFAPPQLLSPRKVPFGVWTIKLPLKRAGVSSRLLHICEHLESETRVSRFIDAVTYRPLWGPLANAMLRALRGKP